jgi:uncharacterized membrane protein
MALIGKLHPLLIHFPIALVIASVAAEGVSLATRDRRWRTLAIGNLRAAAVAGALAAVAGWRMAAGVEATPLLEWHRWAGTLAAGVTIAAALATRGADRGSLGQRSIYRIALAGAGALVAVAGHLGGLLVWGAYFTRP